MIDLANFDIRYSTEADFSLLKSWFSKPQQRDPFPFETDSEMEEMLKAWGTYAKFQASLTGFLETGPCAMGTLFLMPYQKVSHHASFYLIVDPLYRRQGIGTSMVRNLMHLAKTYFKLESIHAEIYEPNPLISILEKLSFEVFAKQQHFVHIEDAMCPRILMEHFFI